MYVLGARIVIESPKKLEKEDLFELRDGLQEVLEQYVAARSLKGHKVEAEVRRMHWTELPSPERKRHKETDEDSDLSICGLSTPDRLRQLGREPPPYNKYNYGMRMVSKRFLTKDDAKVTCKICLKQLQPIEGEKK